MDSNITSRKGRTYMRCCSVPFFVGLIFIFLGGATGLSAQEGATSSDEASFEALKQEIRARGKDNPAQTQRIIQRLEADHSRAANFRAHPDQIEGDLVPLVDAMRINNSSGTTLAFAQAQSKLRRELRWLSRNDITVPPAIGNRVAEALIDIGSEHKKVWSGPNYFPAEVGAGIGNSPRVKAFLYGILKGSDTEERRRTLAALAWSKNLRGDKELYGVLKGLYVSEKDKPPMLVVMAHLEPEDALPILLKEIDTTKDIKTFTEDEDILSQYNRPELLIHPLRRIGDFPRRSLGDAQNPTLGIYPDLLLKYIGQAHGSDLDLGLTALEQSPSALLKSYPVLRERLKSEDVGSRRSTARFLSRVTDVPVFRHPEITDELESINQQETDSQTRETMRSVIEKLHAKAKNP